MHFHSTLSGALAVVLLSGATAMSAPSIGAEPDPEPRGGLMNLFERPREEIRIAQASDPRLIQLEEQVRSLNGRIEELNFQILQMQEQMRKMQEDNEFRLQELERKSGAVKQDSQRDVAKNEQPTSEDRTGEAIAKDDAAVAAAEGTSGRLTATQSADDTAPPSRDFGTITVDKNGNVVSSTMDEPAAATGPQATDEMNVAALPATDDPEELYRNSYQFVLSGDYANAETGFRDHIERFPDDAKAADANYWLGESLLGQQKYREAAEVFLASGKRFPNSKKAPDMLLKLGVSLAGLDQKDVACATFSEVAKRYPDASSALKQRLQHEQAQAAC